MQDASERLDFEAAAMYRDRIRLIESLAQRGTVGDQMEAQESLVHATAETYRLSNLRYTRGIDSYLAVLDAQRSLYGAQQALVEIQMLKLVNQIRLYAVLGGGGCVAE